jgi:hypothetical protein
LAVQIGPVAIFAGFAKKSITALTASRNIIRRIALIGQALWVGRTQSARCAGAAFIAATSGFDE